jgi:hypothetical protein
MKIILDKGKFILAVVVVIVAITSIIWLFRSPKNVEAPTEGIIYYYGKNCPHCQNVAKYIEENKIDQKVAFEKKEFSSPAVTLEFLDRAKQCGISQKDAGVPLIFAEGKCYLGDADAIAFFKEKAGL